MMEKKLFGKTLLEQQLNKQAGYPAGDGLIRQLELDSIKELKAAFTTLSEADFRQKLASVLNTDLGKEAYAQITDSDFADAEAAIRLIFQQQNNKWRDSKTDVDVILSQERQPKGGTENLTNVSLPGGGPGKITAQPGQSGDYGKPGRTLTGPSGGYYSSEGEYSGTEQSRSGIGHIDNPPSQVNSIPRGNRSRGLTPEEARAQSYGEMADLQTRRGTTEVGTGRGDSQVGTTYKNKGAYRDSGRVPVGPTYKAFDKVPFIGNILPNDDDPTKFRLATDTETQRSDRPHPDHKSFPVLKGHDTVLKAYRDTPGFIKEEAKRRIEDDEEEAPGYRRREDYQEDEEGKYTLTRREEGRRDDSGTNYGTSGFSDDNPPAKIPAVPGISGSSQIFRELADEESERARGEADQSILSTEVEADDASDRLEARAQNLDRQAQKAEYDGKFELRNELRWKAIDLRGQAMQKRNKVRPPYSSIPIF